MFPSIRAAYPFVFGVSLSNWFLILTIIPKSFCTEMVVPKLKIDLVCLIDDNLASTCYRENPNFDETSSLFPVLDASNTLVLNDEQETFVGIQCMAPYPVEWVHLQEQWLAMAQGSWNTLGTSQTNTFFMRSVKTLHDTSSFTHMALLSLINIKENSNFAVGHYTCQSANSSLSNSSVQMTVYRERKIYDKAFPLSGNNVTVWTNERNDGTIIFPCHVSFQNVTVNLYKRSIQYIPSKESMTPKMKLNFTYGHTYTLKRTITSHSPPITPTDVPSTEIYNWNIVYPNDRLQWKPDEGFIYQKSIDDETEETLTPLKISPGIYKCVAVEEDNGDDITDDFVIINLKHGNKPDLPVISQAMSAEGKAQFRYSIFEDVNAIQITCCSNSSIPPYLYMVSCFSKSTCVSQRALLPKMEVELLRLNRFSTVEGNCRKSSKISYFNSVPINVRCMGSGIDYIETFIFPVEKNKPENGTQPYVRWEDVDPLKMMQFEFERWDERTQDKKKILLYVDQNVTFKCITSTAYFAIGTRLTIDYQNGSQLLIEDDPTMDKNSNIKWGFPHYTLTVTMHVSRDTVSISCYGAVVKSDKWIKKTLQVHVKDGVSAKIIDEGSQEIYWTLNDASKVLKCEFSGIPSPTEIEWRKDNQVITFRNNKTSLYNHKIIQKQNMSTLLINVVTYDAHGIYECMVENIFGNATKVFQVFVRPPKSHWILISGSLGLGCFVIAFILLGVYTWKERQHLIHTKQSQVLVQID